MTTPMNDPRSATPAASSACTRPARPVAHLTYLGLYALQHRGQESAGIAVSDGETITVVKDMGLVTQVFDERTPRPARRPPRHRPHPLLHHRLEHLAQRAAGLPRRSATPASRSATTATSPTPRRSPTRLGMLPGHAHLRQRARSAELLAARATSRRAALRRPRPRARAASRCCRGSRARSRSC